MTSENIETTQNLNRLSNQALLVLEDELLLRNELATAARSFFHPGRLVIFFLAIVLSMIFLLLLNPLFIILGQQNNPFSIFLYLGCLIGSLFAAQFLWQRVGFYPRYVMRTALHYWPITFPILIYILAYSFIAKT
jgi:predicted ABC-type exoprotein transport system permease subunit